MNNKIYDSGIKTYNKNRIKTPKGNQYFKENEIFIDKKAKSTKKFSLNNKNNILYTNHNNINAINIINNNYNNIYLNDNKMRPNKHLVLDNSNFGIIHSGINKDKSLKKTKALKLIFNKSNNNEKYNENKYQFIIDRLKNEIEYYKNKNKVNSNPIITNSPQSLRKKRFNKNLFLMSNKYNTIKTYDNKSHTETSRKNLVNNYNETCHTNYISDNKLISDFSYKDNLKIYSNYVPKSYSNNFLSIDSSRTSKNESKKPIINYTQNISSPGINKSNNQLSNDIIYEIDNRNDKTSFVNLYNNKLYLNKRISSPLSLKKNIKKVGDTIFSNVKKECEEIGSNKYNYKDKFEKLKNRMNKLIENLFDIIDLQKNKLNKINKK